MKRYGKRLISAILTAVLLLSLLTASCRAADPCQTILEGMTTEEKVSQMIMPAFRTWPGADGKAVGVTEINSDIAACLSRHGFAGVILFAENARESAQTLRLTDAMQVANAAGPNRTQLLTAVDQEGGRVTRLGQGTQGPGNMALGAAHSTGDTEDMARIIGEEIMALGLNLDFAPVLDVNNQPANPVIGLRSFSDDPRIVSEHGRAFLSGLKGTGAIGTLKHFPGHGDTATDSHTGLPLINKSYAQLKANELVPFQAAVDAGAEAIMTAHIQYPQIEGETYVSKSTGQAVTLPATLSKTILTDILRGDMGFKGVVITDALNMDAIEKHFNRMDAARLAIEAGVDILLMPVNVAGPEGIRELDKYIADLTAMVDQGKISPEKVDAAVLRILRLKEAHGLLAPYDGSGLETRVRQAAAAVGSRANHETEWAIAKRAVTLLKNDGGVLPMTKAGQRVTVLTAYDNEVTGMNYAVSRLKDEGKLAGNTSVTVASRQKKSYAQIESLLTGADHVIVVTETGSAAALRGDAAALVDQIIAGTHAQGGKVTVLSAALPYDTARFPSADAIMVAWGARSMSEDPRTKDGPVSSYGPNLPAALYLAFASDETPQGKLPVNIPALDSGYNFTARTLYARGYGLTYPGVLIRHDPPAGCPDPDSCPILPFRDTDPGGWYHDGVHFALDQGLMNGVGEGRFDPEGTASRAMVVTILWRQAGSPAAGTELSFTDVEAGSWYAEAVRWAAEEQVVDGYSPDRFGPSDPVTREQLATILYRLICREGEGLPAGETPALDYPDAGQVSDYAREAMCWMTREGILQGDSQGALRPGDQATRAQLATILMRFQEK